MSKQINPDCLKTGRQARGLSQTELARISGLTQGAISKYENGVLDPTEDAVAKLAAALRFPVPFFYQRDRALGLPLSVQYRRRAGVGQKAMEQLEAEINLRLMHLRRLLSAVNFDPELPLPRLDCDEYGGDGEAIAEMTRRLWQMPSGPVRSLTDVVERAGCVVFQCNFETIGVDGLTIRASGLPPCIFLNSAMPGDRQRFTLAHELGHVIMHWFPSKDMEREANAFAAAFLMPARDVKPQLTGRLTLQRLASLKPLWKTSMGALLYRAKTLGTITEAQADYLWRQYSKAGYRKSEPPELDIPAERAVVLNDVVQCHLRTLGYTIEQMAAALHICPGDLATMNYIDPVEIRPKLRVVK